MTGLQKPPLPVVRTLRVLNLRGIPFSLGVGLFGYVGMMVAYGLFSNFSWLGLAVAGICLPLATWLLLIVLFCFVGKYRISISDSRLRIEIYLVFRIRTKEWDFQQIEGFIVATYDNGEPAIEIVGPNYKFGTFLGLRRITRTTYWLREQILLNRPSETITPSA